MDDYISREAAKEIVHDRAIEMALNNVGFKCDASDVLQSVSNRAKDWLDDVSAADVVPAKRGKWMPEKEVGREYIGGCCVGIMCEDWKCSACGCVVERPVKPKYNFCPQCGADMREVEEDGK